MKKNALFLFIVPAVILSQGCKKDSPATDTAATPAFQAYINTNVWTPDTIAANITYNSALKTKVFSCSGVKDQKKVEIVFNDPSPADNSGLTIGTYNVDATSNLLFNYSTQKKDDGGNYVFEPFGTVQSGSGTLVIAGIDTVKKIITGTFSFTSSKYKYGQDGSIISIDLATVTTGTFQDMPYTFKRE
jgi:hypothetical protein